jgi:hypothetical protein
MTVEQLPAGIAATTIGTYGTATVEFDDDGAGHGWFVDATPTSNEEFLPTADPTLFVAREGSDAAGRLDLLSVLLHEYGHVLGLEHDSAVPEFMSATLAPGVRKLPSQEELRTMARLVADHLAGGSEDPDVPTDNRGPLSLQTRRVTGRGREAARDRLDTQLRLRYLLSLVEGLKNPSFSSEA